MSRIKLWYSTGDSLDLIRGNIPKYKHHLDEVVESYPDLKIRAFYSNGGGHSLALCVTFAGKFSQLERAVTYLFSNAGMPQYIFKPYNWFDKTMFFFCPPEHPTTPDVSAWVKDYLKTKDDLEVKDWGSCFYISSREQKD